MSTPTRHPVVVGFVPTPEGRAAFRAGLAHAGARAAGLVVVNCAHGGAYTDSALATDDELAELRRLAEAAGTSVEIHRAADTQDPVDTVLDQIDRTGADLLVIGIRRRSAVGKLLLGSTALSLLQLSPVPVLAVKAAD